MSMVAPVDLNEEVASVVAASAIPPMHVQATLVDGNFTFNTSGTYPTINENLTNGFEVQIIGGGDLTLSGNQIANLPINNSNQHINIINMNSNKSLYLAQSKFMSIEGQKNGMT